MNCPLCYSNAGHYSDDRRRRYFRCSNCDLIFVDPASLLAREDEKAIYDLHQNDPTDERYRKFLEQLANPLLQKLEAGAVGLDYGCGPGPALNLLLEQRGMTVSLYDIYYYADKNKLASRYDFVTCTEVVEHFSQPAEGWSELIGLLRPGGWLGVMTSMFVKDSVEAFNQWGYKNDPTHVSFYTPKTMAWLAERFQLKHEKVSDRVILFQRLDANISQ